MNGTLTTVEGRVNSNDSTPQATFRATTSLKDHTHSPTLTPGTFHQVLHPTFVQLGSNSQSTHRPFHFPLSQEAPPNQSHHYQTPPNQNIPYQRPQPQPNPVNEVRHDKDQGGYEGEGEEAPWNESPRNRPRGQMLQGGPRGRLGSMPFDRRQHGNHPQGGNQWEDNVEHEVGQEAREEHGNRYHGGHQRGYHYNDQGGHGGRDVGINSIKMTLPTFKGECNPDAYLEWESQCDQIFNVNELAEVKSSCYAIAQFEGYVVTWWEYMKRYHLVVQEGHPPPWPDLKRLMRAKYVPERYRQGLLAKLYNLRQGAKVLKPIMTSSKT